MEQSGHPPAPFTSAHLLRTGDHQEDVRGLRRHFLCLPVNPLARDGYVESLRMGKLSPP